MSEHHGPAQEPQRIQEPKGLTDDDLRYIVDLARQESIVAAFIERISPQVHIAIERSAAVAGLALKAANILTWRQQAREDHRRKLEEEAKRRLTHLEAPQDVLTAPRIQAAEIPPLKATGAPEAGSGNGTAKSEHPGA